MFLKHYKKKLEKRFKNRKQLNLFCDVSLIARLKLLAKFLDTPLYPLAEHVLELGMSEIAVITQEKALTEGLQRHLLDEHLLVRHLNPVDKHVSERARRIKDALKLSELLKIKQ